MRFRFLLISLLALLFAETARAEAFAPSGPAHSCVEANVDVVQDGGGGQVLYRIAFRNRCELPRTFFWCAEHAGTAVPPAVACRSQRGLGGESVYLIGNRRVFQWHLPRGARIRFQDCPGEEIPTADFNCAPLVTPATRR
jgi:hypothetical protein